jgi:hypothetical protein
MLAFASTVILGAGPRIRIHCLGNVFTELLPSSGHFRGAFSDSTSLVFRRHVTLLPSQDCSSRVVCGRTAISSVPRGPAYDVYDGALDWHCNAAHFQAQHSTVNITLDGYVG